MDDFETKIIEKIKYFSEEKLKEELEEILINLEKIPNFFNKFILCKMYKIIEKSAQEKGVNTSDHNNKYNELMSRLKLILEYNQPLAQNEINNYQNINN
jgi:hypothetical protein